MERTLSIGEPTKVLHLLEDVSNSGFQVASDGQRFLMPDAARYWGSTGIRRLAMQKALLPEDWFAEFRDMP